MDESVEMLEEALEAAHLRLQQRLGDEIEQRRAEAERLNKQCEQLRAEATMIEEQAKETAARIVAEARQAEAQMRAEAKQMVDDVQARLRDRMSGFLQQFAEEIAAIQQTISGAESGSRLEADPDAPPTRPARVGEEGAVTRLTVRPALAADARANLKDRVEQLSGVYAVISGAVDDESCEMLIAHEPSAPVRDSILALAPGEIHPTASGAGYVEIELTGVDWLRPS